MFRPNISSGLLQVILARPRIGMMSLVTVSPVITASHSCCLSHHVFDQVNLWPVWVGFETAIFWQCSPGTVETQRLYPLHHGPWRVIRDGFSGLINPYLVFHSRVLKKARGEIWPKCSERRNNTKNYQDEDKMSAINRNLFISVLLNAASVWYILNIHWLSILIIWKNLFSTDGQMVLCRTTKYCKYIF